MNALCITLHARTCPRCGQQFHDSDPDEKMCATCWSQLIRLLNAAPNSSKWVC